MFEQFGEERFYVYTSALHVLDAASVLINVTLIVLIANYSKGTFRKYSIILLCFAVLDLFASVLSWITMARVIPINWGFVTIFHGSCRFVSSQFCSVMYTLNLLLALNLVAMFPFSFWLRYQMVFKEVRRPFKLFALFIVAINVPNSVCVVIYLTSLGSADQLFDLMERAKHPIWPQDRSSFAIGGIVDIIRNWGFLCLMLYVCFLAQPAYALSIRYRRKILRALESAVMSEKTRRAQKNVINALTVQALTPALHMLCVGMYDWKQFNLPGKDFVPYMEELMFIVFSAGSVINASSTIYFVVPYRNALLNCLFASVRSSRRVSSWNLHDSHQKTVVEHSHYTLAI